MFACASTLENFKINRSNICLFSERQLNNIKDSLYRNSVKLLSCHVHKKKLFCAISAIFKVIILRLIARVDCYWSTFRIQFDVNPSRASKIFFFNCATNF